MEDLKIGAAMIQEALDRELVKEEREQRRRAEEKAAHEAAVAKVLQQTCGCHIEPMLTDML